jgi:hypothetical protein
MVPGVPASLGVQAAALVDVARDLLDAQELDRCALRTHSPLSSRLDPVR